MLFFFLSLKIAVRLRPRPNSRRRVELGRNIGGILRMRIMTGGLRVLESNQRFEDVFSPR